MKSHTNYSQKSGSTKIGRFLASKWHYFVVLAFGVVLTFGLWGHLGEFLLGDDAFFHIARMESASKAWANGQIIPQIDPDALGGLGYGYNLFYGPIITYVTAGLQALVGAWPIAINLALILCLIISGLLMCYTMTKISGNPVLAAIVAIFYMAAPYHLTNIYSRVAVGEVVALTVAPILVLGLYQLTDDDSHAARSIALSAALLILSHSLSAVLFALMAAVYVILNIDKIFNIKAIWRMILGVVVALGLTAFFTLPMIDAKLHGNYGVFNEKYSEVYFGASVSSVNDHRAAPFEVVLTSDYTKWPSLSIGLVAIMGLIGFWLVWRHIVERKERRFVISMYVIALLSLFMMSFAVDWNYLPKILLSIQFPWRFMMIFITSMSIVSGYVVRELTRGLTEPGGRVAVVVAGVLAVAPVIGLLERTDNYVYPWEVEFTSKNGSVGWQAEYASMEILCDPENRDDQVQGYACSLDKIPRVMKRRGNKPIVSGGDVVISDYEKNGLNIQFKTKMKEAKADGDDKISLDDVDQEKVAEGILVELPLIYYPGYQATLDGEEIETRASEKYGFVEVVIPAGSEGEVKVKFGVSRPTLYGAIVSAGTAVLGLIWVIISGILKIGKKKKRTDAETLMASMRSALEKMRKNNESDDEPANEAKEIEPKNELKSKSTKPTKPAKTTKTKEVKDEQ